MTAKFRTKPIEVSAWQYGVSKDIPVWVARRVHNLGDGQMTANSLQGICRVEPGYWIVTADFHGVSVFTDAEFVSRFEPIP